MTWLIILGMACITFINRYAFLSKSFYYKPSNKMLRFLSYSSYAILTAIWLPIIIQFEPSQGFKHSGYDYLLATALATVLAILKVPSIVIVIFSSGLFFLLRFFLLAI